MPDNPQSNRAILTKTALDQLIWAPAMTIVFFTFLRVLEGRPDAVLGSLEVRWHSLRVHACIAFPHAITLVFSTANINSHVPAIPARL